MDQEEEWYEELDEVPDEPVTVNAVFKEYNWWLGLHLIRKRILWCYQQKLVRDNWRYWVPGGSYWNMTKPICLLIHIIIIVGWAIWAGHRKQKRLGENDSLSFLQIVYILFFTLNLWNQLMLLGGLLGQITPLLLG